MPLAIPTLDTRTYQDLLDEALARIPVHNPEWTNFNKSDPGVTLLEVFAFLTESLLYRSNQIPERNRRKFLTLLGVPLQPAASASGIVTLSNERGIRDTITLNHGVEVRAGQVPFRTEQGLDVLPLEAQAFYKRTLANPPDAIKSRCRELYASFTGQTPSTDVQLYETAPFPAGADDTLEAVDGSIWIALLIRAADKPAQNTPADWERLRSEVRDKIGGRTLNLGVVPITTDAQRHLSISTPNSTENPTIRYEMPQVGADGKLPAKAADRVPRYRPLDARASGDVLAEPGIVQVALPPAAELRLWTNLDPLEPGVGDFPPALEDTLLNERVITWVRLRSAAALPARVLWLGANAVFVRQREHVANELLPSGTGEPDQTAVLSHKPVIPGSVRLTLTERSEARRWEEIEDLMSAGPEVPAPDLRLPPGAQMAAGRPAEVFALDAEAGEIRFGDGTRGKRPPLGATVRVDYDFGLGRDGNVGAGAINNSPSLPAGFKVTNPVRTWGGAEAETVRDGEKQIARYLQHRDRLVTATDFATIAMRTPGVDLARVDVLPGYTPELPTNEPGDAPGSVTLMIVPKYDPIQPDAPRPDRPLVNAVCAYIDARRLVTTEVFLRGPTYKPIWVSVGVDVVAGVSAAEVQEAVRQALLRFLSPLPIDNGLLDAQTPLLTPGYADQLNGWPLRKAVVDLELAAVASRVVGIRLVNKVLLATGSQGPASQVAMAGLELPRVIGIAVATGDAASIDELRGQSVADAPGPTVVPVPAVPDEC